MKFISTLLLIIVVSAHLVLSQEIITSEPQWTGDIVFIDGADTPVALERQNASVKAKAGASVYLTGIGKTKSWYSVRGKYSTVRVKQNTRLQFIYKASSNNFNPKDIIQVYKLETRKKSRVLKIGSLGTFSGSSQGDIEPLSYRAERYGDSSYLITLENFELGEYAFSLGKEGTTEMNLFGID